MPENVGDLLKYAIKKAGYTQERAAKLLGITRQTLGIYLSKAEIPDEFLRDVRELLKIDIANVNPGPARPTGEQIAMNKAIGENQRRKVPMLGEAVAGTHQELNTTPVYTDQYIDVGDLLRDSEAAFTVYGNSMTPAYPPGCVVGLKRNYDGFIMPGETYVLETASNRVFKRLYWNKDKTAYECYSDNKMIEDSGERKGKFFYEMFEVPKEAVIRIFDVTGMIKRNRNSAIIEKR